MEGFADDPVPLTISFGIASFPAHGETTDDLMESADQALYTAKEIGRDCSVIFSPTRSRAVSGHARAGVARGEARLLSLVTLAESLDAHEHSAARRPATRARSGASSDIRRTGSRGLMLAGVLHDVGKVGIPSSIVMKPGPLTPAEWAVMRKHPEIGASMLEGVDRRRHRGLGPLPPRAPRRHAATRADSDGRRDPAGGTHRGGRRRLRGDDARPRLPAGDRPRARRATSSQQGAGTQFDEEIVEAFLRVLKAEGGPALGLRLRRG